MPLMCSPFSIGHTQNFAWDKKCQHDRLLTKSFGDCQRIRLVQLYMRQDGRILFNIYSILLYMYVGLNNNHQYCFYDADYSATKY